MAERKYFRVDDFSGGINPDKSPALLDDNEAAEILNFRLDKLGSLLARRGYERFTSNAHTSEIHTIGRWNDPIQPNSNIILLADQNGELIRVTATGFQSLMTGLTAARGVFSSGEDLALYCNGTVRPIAFDGVNTFQIGIMPSSSAPTLSSIAGTLMAAEYRYGITYVDSRTGSESSVSESASITLAANSGVELGFPSSLESRVDKIRVYRSEPDGSTLLFLEEIDNGVGVLSFTDPGDALTNVTPEVGPILPQTFDHMAYAKGFWFGTKGDNIYWSEPLDIDSWPTENHTVIEFEGNDTVRALVEHTDTLLICGRYNILVVSGSLGTFYVARSEIDAGFTNDRSYIEVEGQLVYLSYDGLRVFPDGRFFASKLTRTLSALARPTLEAACLTYVPEENAVWLSVGGLTYTIHIPDSAICTYDFITRHFVHRGADRSSLPLFLDSGGNHINRYGSDTDLGEDILVRWTSKFYPVGPIELTKYIRRLGLLANRDSDFSVTLNIGDREAVGRTVNLEPLLSGEVGRWDVDNWDEFFWDTDEQLGYFVASIPPDVFGHTIRIEINASVRTESEFLSPISLEYRETNRFLGR